MKIYVRIKLQTDGDFYLEENCEHEENVIRDWEKYYIYKCFKEVEPPHSSWKPEDWMRFQVKSFLEEILVSLRFNPAHYYLMSDLCTFFGGAINAVNSLEVNSRYEDYLSGNYYGTEIILLCKKE